MAESSFKAPYVVQRELAESNFLIRRIDLDHELAEVKRIFELGMRLYCDPLPKGSVMKTWWEGYIADALAADLSDIETVYLKPGGDFWVVVDKTTEGKIVGCVGVEKKSDGQCELRRMSINPDARKGGLGSKLVRQVEEFAALNGFQELVLSTGSIMVPAIGLYHRTGFECNGLRWATGEYKEALDSAGEQFYGVLFQKPITSNDGRWMWSSFEPHPTVTNPPTHIKQIDPPVQPPHSKEYFLHRELKASSFTIRRIDVQRDLADVKRIFEIGMRLYCDPLPKESVLKYAWEHYIAESIATDLSDIEGVYLKPGGDFWVVVDERSGLLVGCVGVEKKSNGQCELRRMSVDPNARKGGLGSKLVRQVEEFAAINGFTELVLSTGSIMVPAIGLYHRTGFECCKVQWAEGKFKDRLDEAGEQLYNVYFRKPITSNHGRWLWAPFVPHWTATTPPTHIRPGGPVRSQASL